MPFDATTYSMPLPEFADVGFLWSRISTDKLEDAKRHPHERQRAEMESDLRWYFTDDGRPIRAAHYRKDTISGTVRFPPGIAAFIELVEKRQVGYLVVWRIDRFSRDVINGIELFGYLERNGIRLIATDDELDSRKDRSRIIEALSDSEKDHQKIYKRMADQKLYNAMHGMLPSGTAPYGYAKDETGAWAVVEEQAAVIRKMFAWRIAGVSHNDIANRLNDVAGPDYAPAPAGGRWQRGSVQKKLTLRTYAGVKETYAPKPVSAKMNNSLNRHNRTRWADFRKAQQRGERGAIEIENLFPAIISQETFDAAQDMAKVNKADASRNRKHTQILTRAFFCARCGRAMIYRPQTRDGVVRYEYYRCRSMWCSNEQGEQCGAKQVRMELADGMAIAAACDWLMDEARHTSILLQPRADQDEQARHLAELQRQLKENRETASNYRAERMRPGLDAADRKDIEAAEERLRDERRQLESRVAAIEGAQVRALSETEEREGMRNRQDLARYLRAAPVEEANAIMRDLFVRIVWDDRTQAMSFEPRDRPGVLSPGIMTLATVASPSTNERHSCSQLLATLTVAPAPFTIAA
jgi:DNA invertase Pin-like site-specific DNA recombinase